MAVQITRIRQTGTTHASITNYEWNQNGRISAWTKAEGVAWVRRYPGQTYVSDGWNTSIVYVVESGPGAPYLRTRADNVWTDNLLSLPRF